MLRILGWLIKEHIDWHIGEYEWVVDYRSSLRLGNVMVSVSIEPFITNFTKSWELEVSNDDIEIGASNCEIAILKRPPGLDGFYVMAEESHIGTMQPINTNVLGDYKVRMTLRKWGFVIKRNSYKLQVASQGIVGRDGFNLACF